MNQNSTPVTVHSTDSGVDSIRQSTSSSVSNKQNDTPLNTNPQIERGNPCLIPNWARKTIPVLLFFTEEEMESNQDNRDKSMAEVQLADSNNNNTVPSTSSTTILGKE